MTDELGAEIDPAIINMADATFGVDKPETVPILDPDNIVVTEEMLKAGADEVSNFNDEYDCLWDYLPGVFREMLRVHIQQQEKERAR